jgi:hypothetical protein
MQRYIFSLDEERNPIGLRIFRQTLIFRHGFHWFKPEVRVLEDNEEKTKIIKWYVKKHPGPSKKLFGWNPKNDDPKSDDLRKFAESFPIIILKRSIKT